MKTWVIFHITPLLHGCTLVNCLDIQYSSAIISKWIMVLSWRAVHQSGILLENFSVVFLTLLPQWRHWPATLSSRIHSVVDLCWMSLIKQKRHSTQMTFPDPPVVQYYLKTSVFIEFIHSSVIALLLWLFFSDDSFFSSYFFKCPRTSSDGST